MFGKKRDKEDNGLDVIEDIKEPFSFANFFEDHIVGRWRTFKKFLDEKGILFFLLSPFQYRNRLIAKIVLIIFGILIGVVPRMNKLVQAAKARNAASEIASLLENETIIRSGRIVIRPLASSQYEKQHMIAFLITGETSDGVPSSTNRYNVELKGLRGVLYPEDVTYNYEILPVDGSRRLLLVYMDNRKQDDNTGIYNLYVEVAADNIEDRYRTPIEIVLSNTQKTNELFNEQGINLSVLTNPISDSDQTPLADARKELETQLENYELEEERINNLPFDMTVDITTAQLRDFVYGNILLPDLMDTSTTTDIVQMEEIMNMNQTTNINVNTSITYNDVSYNKEMQDDGNRKTQSETVVDIILGGDETSEKKTSSTKEITDTTQETFTEEETVVFTELVSLENKTKAVIDALNKLNNTNRTKYNSLSAVKLILNQRVSLEDFTGYGVVANVRTIDDTEVIESSNAITSDNESDTSAQ